MTSQTTALERRIDEFALGINLHGARLERELTRLADGIAANQGMVARIADLLSEMRDEARRGRSDEVGGAGHDGSKAATAVPDALAAWCDEQATRSLAAEARHGDALDRIAALVRDLQAGMLSSLDRWGGDVARLEAIESSSAEASLRSAVDAVAETLRNGLLDLQNGQDTMVKAAAERATSEAVLLEAVNSWRDQRTVRSLSAESQHRDDLDRIAALVLDVQKEMLASLDRWGGDVAQRLRALENRASEEPPPLVDAVTAVAETLRNSLLNLQNGQGTIANIVAENRLRIEKYGSETYNLVTHVFTSVESHLNSVHTDVLDSTHAHEILAQQLTLRHLLAGEPRREQQADEAYKPASQQPFERYLSYAENDFPRVFPLWKERLDAISEAFRATKIGNAANALDVHSRAFKRFVGLFARGRVLDIGSGVFGRAFYLRDYPFDLVSEIDPLPLVEATDAEHVQGIGEYLPWPDRSFSTVISGTSLDHCLSLEKSLLEIRRVLAPGGRFLLWIGSNPGASAYRPDFEGFEAADRFHLFHFDAAWFEPILDTSYEMIERVEMKMPSFSHIFYCLQAHPEARE